MPNAGATAVGVVPGRRQVVGDPILSGGGDYTITMWHEVLGTASKTVTVEPGGDSRIDFLIGT